MSEKSIINHLKSIFKFEKEMQDWLQEEFDKKLSLADLITNTEKFEGFIPSSPIERKIFNSFNYCLKGLWSNIILSSDENISISRGKSESLKPDFTFYDEERESIVIVELKNSKNASRQTGTEFGAYSNEIKSHFPYLSDGDVINVIISPIWATLLKNYIFHEIFWLDRNIICLEPIKENEENKLKIIDINSLFGNIFIKNELNKLGGFQICLYDYEKITKEERKKIYPSLDQMRIAMDVIAKTGNAQKNNGFAFLWKDLSGDPLSPYNITIVNISAYKQIFENNNISQNNFTEKLFKTIQTSNSDGHGGSLFKIATEVKKILGDFCTPECEGFTNWKELYKFMKGNKLISFYSWGIYEDLFLERILKKQKKGDTKMSLRSPDEGIEFIRELLGDEFENSEVEHSLPINIDDDFPF